MVEGRDAHVEFTALESFLDRSQRSEMCLNIGLEVNQLA